MDHSSAVGSPEDIRLAHCLVEQLSKCIADRDRGLGSSGPRLRQAAAVCVVLQSAWARLHECADHSARATCLASVARAIMRSDITLAETLIKTIAEWERKLADYVETCPHDSMSERDKIL